MRFQKNWLSFYLSFRFFKNILKYHNYSKIVMGQIRIQKIEKKTQKLEQILKHAHF